MAVSVILIKKAQNYLTNRLRSGKEIIQDCTNLRDYSYKSESFKSDLRLFPRERLTVDRGFVVC